MSKRLLALNLLLLAASGLLVAYIVRQATTPWPQPTAARSRPLPVPGAPPASVEPTVKPPPGSHAIVASRNLFSPTRTEAPPPPVTAAPAVALPKPNLYGVVVREQAPIAYMEDPVTKRVAGYRLGDAIAGGTVQAINADRVVLARPDGNVDIRLHDPSRPRPVPPAATTTPATPGTTPPPTARGAIPSLPGVTTPSGEQPASTPRRPLPPSLLRRLPSPAGAEAPPAPQQ